MEGMKLAKQLNKKVYLTANIFARNLKIKSFIENLDRWSKLKPDAMIMSDPGLISIVKERHPEIPIHLSVQANCMNWQAVKFWRDQGLSRIILSRELRLTEIKEIHERVPDIELEAFVHGSICIAYSGRCLLSHYMSYRDANQGVCDNSCRYPYKLYKNNEAIADEFQLQDLRDTTQMYPIEEDEHGTYIMNSKDLCLIEHLKDIRDAGVISFKVEGRTKSEFYAAMVSRAYRTAIDDMMADKKFNPLLLQDLERLANRGYHKGFMMGEPTHQAQNYESTPRAQHSHFLGFVRGESNTEGYVSFEPRSKMELGQEIEFIDPQGTHMATVLGILDHNNSDSKAANPGTKGLFKVKFSKFPKSNSLVLKNIPVNGAVVHQ
jgi:putative protease